MQVYNTPPSVISTVAHLKLLLFTILCSLAVSQDIPLVSVLMFDWRSFRGGWDINLLVYKTPQYLLNIDPMEASVLFYQLLLSGCQTKHSLVSLLTSDWWSFRRGWSLNLSRWNCKLVNISFSADYAKIHKCLKKK